MGIKTSKAVGQYIAKQEFVADPDVPVYFRITEVMMLMPIMMKRDCSDTDADSSWIDASGFFDICFDATMEKMQFISRRPGRETFAYRYVSSFFPQSAFKG